MFWRLEWLLLSSATASRIAATKLSSPVLSTTPNLPGRLFQFQPKSLRTCYQLLTTSSIYTASSHKSSPHQSWRSGSSIVLYTFRTLLSEMSDGDGGCEAAMLPATPANTPSAPSGGKEKDLTDPWYPAWPIVQNSVWVVKFQESAITSCQGKL